MRFSCHFEFFPSYISNCLRIVSQSWKKSGDLWSKNGKLLKIRLCGNKGENADRLTFQDRKKCAVGLGPKKIEEKTQKLDGKIEKMRENATMQKYAG